MDNAWWLAVPWFLPVLGKVLFGNLVSPYLNKRISTGLYLPQKLALQFLIAGTVAIGFALLRGTFAVSALGITIACVGFLNASANLAQWKAHAVSLSRTSLFMLVNPGIALLITTTFLHESQVVAVKPWLLAGVALCFLGAGLVTYLDFRNRGASRVEVLSSPEARQFYTSVAIYSVVWGGANAFAKYASLEAVPISTYVAFWYIGSFFGAIALSVIASRRTASPVIGKNQISTSDAFWIAVLALATIGSFACLYWAHFRAPQLVVFPLFIVGDLIAPIVVGMLFFGEHKRFTHGQLACLGIAVIGGTIVAFSR